MITLKIIFIAFVWTWLYVRFVTWYEKKEWEKAVMIKLRQIKKYQPAQYDYLVDKFYPEFAGRE